MKLKIYSIFILILFSCNITENSNQTFPLPLEDSDSIPPLLSKYCTAKSEEGKCNCENMYIKISAYLDITNLPMANRVINRIIIISSPDNYGSGSDMVHVFYETDTLSNTFQQFLYDNAPIKVAIRNAQVIKEMVPINNAIVPIWYLNCMNLYNISFFAKDENGEFKLLNVE